MSGQEEYYTHLLCGGIHRDLLIEEDWRQGVSGGGASKDLQFY